MPASKRRPKAAAKKKSAARKKEGGSVRAGLGQVVWDDEADALLTSRGWVSERMQGAAEMGDSWDWYPSQLPLDVDGAGEPVPTAVHTDPEGGFLVELASADGTRNEDRTRHYPDLEALTGALEDLEAWRVPAGDYRTTTHQPLAETVEQLCRMYAAGVLADYELIAELAHFPYTKDPFMEVTTVRATGMVPDWLLDAVARTLR